jgi:hypothetical protein
MLADWACTVPATRSATAVVSVLKTIFGYFFNLVSSMSVDKTQTRPRLHPIKKTDVLGLLFN